MAVRVPQIHLARDLGDIAGSGREWCIEIRISGSPPTGCRRPGVPGSSTGYRTYMCDVLGGMSSMSIVTTVSDLVM